MRAVSEVSEATRHVMQANRSKNTRPELMVREALRTAGLGGYRLHWRKAAGSPDICYPGRRLAIFVNGCFWHRCPHCGPSRPRTNVEFWEAKFARNRARDASNQGRLVREGWTVAVVWECRLREELRPRAMEELVALVRSCETTRQFGRFVEIGSMRPWRLRVTYERLARARRR
ncbi:very short patch repair endonuclease [Olsenella sp. HMSC062G07]|nr:very short patch repair endonuclease [Olsenella sp. HMSC062G07]